MTYSPWSTSKEPSEQRKEYVALTHYCVVSTYTITRLNKSNTKIL